MIYIYSILIGFSDVVTINDLRKTISDNRKYQNDKDNGSWSSLAIATFVTSYMHNIHEYSSFLCAFAIYILKFHGKLHRVIKKSDIMSTQILYCTFIFGDWKNLVIAFFHLVVDMQNNILQNIGIVFSTINQK